jgi:hypothetical protein
MPDSTLNAIRVKARRLTRSPSTDQISDATIDEYINTFLIYDFPSHLKLSYLRKSFNFYTQPYVDTYTNDDLFAQNPMFNFKNLILTSSDPVYVAGYRTWFSQSKEEFFLRWNYLRQIQQIGLGNGVSTVFTGTLQNIPITPTETLFTSIDIDFVGIGMKAVPVFDPATGIQTQFSNLYYTNGIIPERATVFNATNFVDNRLGGYTITFPTAPGANQKINVQAVPYQAARPTAVLYFANTFTLRPIPDQQYQVNVECNVLPTELLDAGQDPDLNQWWQYIAYGAAKKILEDRLDNETLALIMPEFKEQEKLVLRRTIEQQGDQRSSTIYSQRSYGDGNSWGWWN